MRQHADRYCPGIFMQYLSLIQKTSAGIMHIMVMCWEIYSLHIHIHWGIEAMLIGKYLYAVKLLSLNTLRPRQNDPHLPYDIFKFPLNFVSQGPINNVPALVQMMDWRWPGDKPLSESTMVRLPKHICISQPQWVDVWRPFYHSLTRSISCLLMPLLLASPGHQQPWY